MMMWMLNIRQEEGGKHCIGDCMQNNKDSQLAILLRQYRNVVICQPLSCKDSPGLTLTPASDAVVNTVAFLMMQLFFLFLLLFSRTTHTAFQEAFAEGVRRCTCMIVYLYCLSTIHYFLSVEYVQKVSTFVLSVFLSFQR